MIEQYCDMHSFAFGLFLLGVDIVLALDGCACMDLPIHQVAV
jgi:hypothetical protein